MTWSIGTALVLGALLLAPAKAPADTSVRDALRTAPGLVGLGDLGPRYRNAADALVDAAARAIPIPSMSGGFIYRFDPATGTYQQTQDTFGPLPFMERPQTLGRNVWSFNVTGQYLELDEFDGKGVGKDPFPLLGLANTSGPTRFFASPKFVYHLATINVTLGVLDDLDVNIAVPLGASDSDTNASRIGPSGALIGFATEHAQESFNVRDILLRGKYRLFEWDGLTGALGVALRVPSGDPDTGFGTGDTDLGPFFAISALYWDRVEPSWNAGFDFDLNDSHLSSGHYAFGVDVQAVKDWLNFGVAFLGRSQIDGQRSPGAVSALHLTPNGPALAPFEGVNLNRKDTFDFQGGARVRLYKTLLLTVSAVKGLNDDGLRSSNWSPVGGLEATF